MKKLLLAVCVLTFHFAFGQHSVDNLFTVRKITSEKFDKVMSKYTILDADPQTLLDLSENAYTQLDVKIPLDGGGPVTLHLKPNKLFSDNFKVTTTGKDGKQDYNYKAGKYYRGTITPAKHSMVAASFFRNDIVIVFADEQGNVNLEKIRSSDKNVDGKYILYREKDMKIANTYRCGVSELAEQGVKKSQVAAGPAARSGGNSVCAYFECDYSMYTKRGNNATDVLDYFTGLINIVSTLYTNDGVNFTISGVNVWTTQDPYTGTSSFGYLASFKSILTTYPGDVAALLSSSSGGYGGVADDIGTLCTNHSYNYSDLEYPGAYVDAVVYSWSANVVTHEFGHNFGSRHTHACVWNGNNTAIDACAPTYGGGYEGSCSGAPLPADGGTIMSYCHLGSVGINFVNGFGPQPAATIRNYISSSACSLGACSSAACTTPSNDDCDSAQLLTVNNSGCSYTSGSVCGATPSSPAISPACGDSSAVGKDVWYKFVANRTTATIQVKGGLTMDAVLQVFSAVNCSSSSNTQIACIDSTDSAGLEHVSLTNLSIGNTYWIRIYNKKGTPGYFQVCVSNPATNILNCSGAVTLTCGQIYSGTTVGGNTDVLTYSCASGLTFQGPEKVFKYTQATAGTITVNLSGNGMRVFLMSGCGNSCLSSGNAQATYYNAPAGTYYIVVDGYQGTGGQFDIAVDCPPKPLDCTNAITLTCGQPVTGTTVGGATNVSQYSCASGYNEAGPERVYKITTTTSGTLSVLLNSNTTQQVFVLSSCSENSCVAYGTSGATYYNAPAGTYYIVVDSYFGYSGPFTLTVSCPSSSIDCSTATPITCGQTVTGTTVGASANANTYSCGYYSYIAPEKVYTITTTSTSDLMANITTTGSLNVFILSSCSGSSCVASGTYTATYYGAPAGTYYIVVDGYQGTGADFTLSVACVSNILDCSSATPITCGQTVTGTTVGNPANVNLYSCTNYNSYQGPEKVYSITTTQTADLNLTLTSTGNGSLYAFIFNSCNTSSCVAYGSNVVSFQNAPPGTYYIVVDGYGIAGGTFSLAVSCANNIIDCSTATPITCGQTVNGTTVGATNNVNTYSCLSYQTGPEKVYKITTTSTMDLTASITTTSSSYMSVLILSGCSASSCVAYGYNSATYQNAPPGTYYIVIDGSSATGSPFSLNVSCADNIVDCSSATPITCGQSVSGTTVGGTSRVNTYNCSTYYLELGPEKVYSITTTTTMDLVANFSSTGNGSLRAFILGSCNASSCLAQSYGTGTATYNNAPPGTYYIVIDGENAAGGTYNLSVSCVPNILDCTSATPISCGQSVSGTTVGTTNNVNRYSCSSGSGYTGGEKVYTITTTTTSDLTVSLNSITGSSLYVFILNSCNSSSCAASGYTSATYQNAPAGTYYIVVDGYQGATGAYTLSVACATNVLDCSNATTITCGQQVNGTTIGEPSNVNRYGCGYGYTQYGPEKIYKITTTSAGDLYVNLNTSSLSIYIMNSCSAASCLAYGTGSASYLNAPAGTYYIVIDGTSSAGSPFTLSVNCSSNILDCSTAIPLTCGVAVTSTTAGGSANAARYSCSYNYEVGPEKIYTVTTTAAGNLVATLSSSYSHVYILSSCSTTSCVASGYSGATYYSAPAGTYYIVVDGPQTAGDSYTLKVTCPSAAIDCNSAIAISCGQQVSGTTVGAPSNANSYSCLSSGSFDGAERVYKLTTTNISDLTVNLSSNTYQYVIILDSCSGRKCVGYGSSIASYANAPAGTYYIVVDDYAGYEGSYTLSVACATNILDCSSATEITCGQTITGTTLGEPSNVNKYTCASGWMESGSEKVYKVTTMSPGDLTVSLNSGNLNVFILSSCSNSSCVAYGTYYATYYNAPAGTYYIVIDGYQGASGPFSFTLTCNSNCAAPTTQAANLLTGAVTQNSLTLYWSRGNGGRSVVTMNTANNFTAPANGTDPLGSTVYTGGGQQTIYNGTGTNTQITGLTPGSSYCFRVYDVNCVGSATSYNLNTSFNNPICKNTLLPLHLVSFRGEASKANALLTWVAAQEQNMSRYEVERSFDGVNFVKIGSVAAKNSTAEVTYRYTDLNILSESVNPVFYYRLKEIDIDGTFRYSEVVAVSKPDNVDYIRPVNTVFSDQLNFVSSLDKQEKVQFRLMNSLGQIAFTTQLLLHGGNSTFSLSNLPALTKGNYYLQVIREGSSQSFKILKQ